MICAVSNWILSSQVHWKPALRPTSTQASRRRRRKPTYRKTNATTPIHVRLSSTNLSLAINQTKFHFHSSSFYHQFASLPIHHPKEWLQFFTVLPHVSSQISRDLRLASQCCSKIQSETPFSTLANWFWVSVTMIWYKITRHFYFVFGLGFWTNWGHFSISWKLNFSTFDQFAVHFPQVRWENSFSAIQSPIYCPFFLVHLVFIYGQFQTKI